MFDDLEKAILTIYAFAFIGMTLGIWKIIEIIFWIFKHINITIH